MARGSPSWACFTWSAESKPRARKFFSVTIFCNTPIAVVAASWGCEEGGLGGSLLFWQPIMNNSKPHVKRRERILITSCVRDVVKIVPMGVVVAGTANVFIISVHFLHAAGRRPWVVHAYIVGAVDRDVPGGDHHVATAAVPMPGKGEGLLRAIDLALNLGPGEGRIRSRGRREIVLGILRPSPVHARVGHRRVAAICAAEFLVGLVALLHVGGGMQVVHGHLSAGGPAPHPGLLAVQSHRNRPDVSRTATTNREEDKDQNYPRANLRHDFSLCGFENPRRMAHLPPTRCVVGLHPCISIVVGRRKTFQEGVRERVRRTTKNQLASRAGLQETLNRKQEGA